MSQQQIDRLEREIEELTGDIVRADEDAEPFIRRVSALRHARTILQLRRDALLPALRPEGTQEPRG